MSEILKERIEQLVVAIKNEHKHLDKRCRYQIYDFYQSVINLDERIVLLERLLFSIAYSVGSNNGGFQLRAIAHRQLILSSVGLVESDLNYDESIKFNHREYWQNKKALGYPKCPWYDDKKFTSEPARI